jgi:outer membrane protein
MLKKNFLWILVVGALMVPATAGAEGLKIGYVVKPRLMGGSKIGQQAGKDLEGRLAKAQKELDRKAEEIKEMQEDIKRKMMVLSEDEKKKVMEEHEREVRAAKRMQEDLQRELRAAEAETLEKINEHMVKVINEYGDKNGFDLIIDASALLYASDAADITDEIIAASDKMK